MSLHRGSVEDRRAFIITQRHEHPTPLQTSDIVYRGHPSRSSPSSALSSPFHSAAPASPAFDSLQTTMSTSTATATRPYNPQQWLHHGPVSGSHVLFSRSPRSTTAEASGMESSMPSPPPPYTSPGLDQRSPRASPRIRDSPLMTSPRQTSRFHSTNAFAPISPPITAPARLSSSSTHDGHVNCRIPFHAPLVLEDSSITSSPPAARRAVSMGALGQSHAPALDSSSASPAPRPFVPWRQGMPLPPPPPAPPPTTRSQSLNRPPNERAWTTQRYHPTNGPTLTQRHTLNNALGPVPPTPADWTEEHDGDGDQPELPVPSSAPVTAAHGTSALVRRPAQREPSAEGIRERRSRSKAYREPSENGDSHNPDETTPLRPLGPSDLVLSEPRKRNTVPKHDVPRQSKATRVNNAQSSVLTPPYTPASGEGEINHKQTSPQAKRRSANARFVTASPTQRTIHSATERLSSTGRAQAVSSPVPHKTSSFVQAGMERYRKLMELEEAAENDGERLRLFARFMMNESRLRRQRYASTFDHMAMEMYDLTGKMWQPQATTTHGRHSHGSFTPGRKMSIDSIDVASDSPALASSSSSLADSTPATDTESLCDDGDGHARTDKYHPSLSPIPSMAMSTVPDDDSSRGRSASRWWESSTEGSRGGGLANKVERTKKEMKYMSLHPDELRFAAVALPNLSTPTQSAKLPTETTGYPSDEKTGWHDETNAQQTLSPRSACEPMSLESIIQGYEEEPSPIAYAPKDPLDVSRLVTLPPSYPRHYPALNNSHPVLEDLRQQQRDLGNLDHIKVLTSQYSNLSDANRRKAESEAASRRDAFESRLQTDVETGNMTQAEAADATTAFGRDEAERAVAGIQDSYHCLQNKVTQPGTQFLDEKIEQGNACMNMMILALTNSELSGDSNSAQVEGDEEPELLEQLTLLKWLFEGREHAHKALFDLQLLEKRSAQAIPGFDGKFEEQIYEDAIKQVQLDYATQAHGRFAELQDVVESHVSRGVEAQMSAFWDIAPQLDELVQRVPLSLVDLDAFDVAVPATELHETPSYRHCSLRYLFATLCHSQKSTYQFIESQVNLLCLLHEVQSASMAASTRLIDIQRLQAGDDQATTPGIGDADLDMDSVKLEQEVLLTEELKDKVAQVEHQWRAALGNSVEACRESVKGWLVGNGRWDDGLEEE